MLHSGGRGRWGPAALSYFLFVRGLNKVTLIGNLGKDPEINVLEGNVPVARFSLATTETWRDKAGQPYRVRP